MKVLPRWTLPLVSLLCASCGGGGGGDNNPFSFDGVWTGRLTLVTDCVTAGPPADDVTMRDYRLTSSTQDDTDGFGFRDFMISDSLGNTYSGDQTTDTYALAHNDAEEDQSDEMWVTGPSNIGFENPTNTSVEVRFVYFHGHRFCSDVYEGVFSKVVE